MNMGINIANHAPKRQGNPPK